MKRTDGIFRFMVLLAAGLLAGCSGDDTSDAGTEATEIRFNADVWRVMEGSRATTYDNAAALQSEGSFTCSAYVAEGTTPYISSSPVAWNTDKWEFADGKHYWPMEGSLDFFAYMPATLPSYLSVNYSTARSPQVTCTNLPMTYDSENPTAGQGSSMKEFVYALQTNQSKASQGASGVTLTFKHPFARIYFQLAASHPDVTIYSITFKDVKTGGTCSFNGTASTWTPSDATADFTMNLNDGVAFNSNPATPSPIGGPFLMVPQTFDGDIVVRAGWIDWGEVLPHNVSTTVSTTWEPGYSYTYTFTITESDLIVNTTKFTEQW